MSDAEGSPRPEPPDGLGRPGAAYWDRITAGYEVADYALPLLEQACRCLDTLAALDHVVAREGIETVTRDGTAAPARFLAEQRAQRDVFARLVRTLKLPALDADDDQDDDGYVPKRRRAGKGRLGPGEHDRRPDLRRVR